MRSHSPGHDKLLLHAGNRPEGAQSFRRNLLEAAIQALPVGVVVHDAQGQCVLANSAALRMQETGVDEGKSWQASGAALALLGDRALESEVASIRCDDESYSLTTMIDVSKHEQVQKALLGRAYLDSLTGLPNRALVEQCVEDLIESVPTGEEFALAFIDLDSFKHINDYYSHAAGDALLQRVAERISHCLRPSDVLARIGGDEFVLLMTPVSGSAMAEPLVHEVAGRLKAPFLIDGHEIFISASIGVSMFPSDGRTYDALRRHSDSAMYRAKSEVKGGVVFFRESMGQAATARMATEQRLRSAIRDKRFCCAFQPKVEMRTGEVQGIEVLLRWRDEQGLIQAPGDFVSLAVELGLINEIAFLVLAETVRSIDEIDEAFGPDVTISINVAAKQACDIEFMTSFVGALAATDFAERFTIELTEEAFFSKGRFQTLVLPHIREAGIRVSIDDFGVGYSSLAALAEITADELKIDRSFIRDIHKRPRSQIVLRAIESLGRALGMSLVAEGVETFEEAAYLQAATQIRLAQGYYFARPLALDEMRNCSSTAVSRDPKGPGLQTRAPSASRRA